MYNEWGIAPMTTQVDLTMLAKQPTEMSKASPATAAELVACYRSGQIDEGTMVQICYDRPDVRAIFEGTT